MWKSYFDYVKEYPEDDVNKVLFLMNRKEQ